MAEPGWTRFPALLDPHEPALDRARARARLYAAAQAPNTRRAYRSAWRRFQAWLASLEPAAAVTLEAEPTPDETLVALYLADQAPRLAVSTLKLHLAALISHARQRGRPLDRRHPVLAAVLAGIERSHGRPSRQVDALDPALLPRLVAGLPFGVRGCRDRALILLGFAAALRRSELVALDRQHLTLGRRALHLLLARSKTDPRGEGALIQVEGQRGPSCALSALRAWLRFRGEGPGPLFRPISKSGRILTRRLNDRTVARILQAALTGIGIAGRYAGHSLRAGLATSRYAAGDDPVAIGRHTRHASLEGLARYLRRHKPPTALLPRS